MKTKIEFTRVNNDVNGNPRYVCHFTNLILEADRRLFNPASMHYLDNLYNTAVKRARKIGGRKFHNKQYGGGIVFQSYNIAKTEQDILNLLNS